jgi:two-component system phosphate regulon response regulator PhoB
LASKHIMIIEDEKTLRDMLRYVLKSDGYDVTATDDVEPAKNLINDKIPDLLIIDWMLPTMSGKDFVIDLRSSKKTKELPIILLTARTQEIERLAGFAAGVDDYITKPFSTKELLARVNALLRRSKKSHEDIIGNTLKIHLAAKRVCHKHTEINLSPIEYKLLVFLATNPDRVYSRDQLLTNVWGADAYIDERTVDAHMRRLRAKLKPFDAHKLIQTVRGSGYRFLDEDE